MIIYVDVVFLINLIFDFSLLLTVDVILKRKAKLTRILFGALVGELSMATMFWKFDTISLSIFKIALSIIMSFAAFGYEDKKYTFYNVLYIYLLGIILGGFITFLYNEFRVNREYSFRYLAILFLSPIVLVAYYHLQKKIKNDYNNRYDVLIEYGEYRLHGTGFLDSGNKLVSPISGRPIILVEKEYLTLHKLKLLPVPYNALNHSGILECFRPDRVTINGVIYKEVLIGVSEIDFHIDGCSILLNSRLEII